MIDYFLNIYKNLIVAENTKKTILLYEKPDGSPLVSRVDIKEIDNGTNNIKVDVQLVGAARPVTITGKIRCL